MMKITVFTNNHPRHLSLVERLAAIAGDIHVIHECNTLFTGVVADFIRKSEVMQRYWARVSGAEARIFGRPRFVGVKNMPLLYGDVSLMTPDMLGEAAEADVFVVFGASFIKGEMCDFLVEKKAVNIHMGIAPAYRGHSCNFWAMHDDNPDYVGATVHRLSKGLDQGSVLFHCFPDTAPEDPFDLGMMAVRSAHKALAERIADGSLLDIEPVPQNRDEQIRYSRGSDFTDEIADAFLERPYDREATAARLASRDLSAFRFPFIG
jgi:hypothetical protein